MQFKTACSRGRLADRTADRPLDNRPRKILIETASAARLSFDTLYPALGSSSNTDLLRSLGASLSSQGCILVDSHQMTDVSGLYAAGDVVQGLDQISVACGQAAIAATAIHNRLRKLDGLGDP